MPKHKTLSLVIFKGTLPWFLWIVPVLKSSEERAPAQLTFLRLPDNGVGERPGMWYPFQPSSPFPGWHPTTHTSVLQSRVRFLRQTVDEIGLPSRERFVAGLAPARFCL